MQLNNGTTIEIMDVEYYAFIYQIANNESKRLFHFININFHCVLLMTE